MSRPVWKSSCRSLRLGLCVAGLASVLLSATSTAARTVDLELILAVDTSSSVDFNEFNLQISGYVAAFSDPAIMTAIRAAGPNGIAVALVQWAGVDQQQIAVGWTYVSDGSSALAFAKAVAAVPRYFNFGATAIGDVIRRTVPLFGANNYEGSRQVIDISGDGRSNEGLPPQLVRQAAILAGITVNGLAILNEEPGLEPYFQRHVIGGPSAFLITAEDYGDFKTAVLAKLIQEIVGAPIASLLVPRHASLRH